MFVKAIRIARNAMFPIFRLEQVNPTSIRINVVGSGFFVNRRGHFVTVSHIFDNPTPQTVFQYRGQIPDSVQNPPIVIQEVARNDDFDIFIGQINIRNPGFFYFSNSRPEIGRSVCLSGYPLAQISVNAQGVLDVSGARRYFQPTFILDHVRVNNDNGFGRIRTHDGFLVRDVGLFGMSGGPVLDINGRIIGMQSSVTQPRASIGGEGRTISVENAVAIRSGLMLDLLRRNHIRFNLLGNI